MAILKLLSLQNFVCEFVINEIVLETHAVFCLHVMTKNNPTWESLLDLKRKICEIMTLQLYVYIIYSLFYQFSFSS